jgi:release factor glutamine methyltransferase
LPLRSTSQPANIRYLLQASAALLPDTDTARIECEILLCNVIGQERHFLYAHSDTLINERDLADFNSLIAKRASGFPVAYLTGSREFWSLQLEVNQHTLIPRPETELLVELAFEMTGPDIKANILDLGTGSGAIAIAIASERPACSITASDVSLPALSMAQQNAARLGMNQVRFVHSDWFSTLDPQRFDLIVSNPPYVESSDAGFINGDIRHEPRIALDGGRQGLDIYHHIIPAARTFLKSGGRLLLEHGHTQGEAIRELLSNNHYLNIETRQDFAGLDRVSLASLP